MNWFVSAAVTSKSAGIRFSSIARLAARFHWAATFSPHFSPGPSVRSSKRELKLCLALAGAFAVFSLGWPCLFRRERDVMMVGLLRQCDYPDIGCNLASGKDPLPAGCYGR